MQVHGLSLLDTPSMGKHGGTGQLFDWQLWPKQNTQNVFLAGGLRPQNVATAVHRLRPWAVDVASGMESEPGIKDHELMREFMQQVRSVSTSE